MALSLREKRFINNRLMGVSDPYFWENTELDLGLYRYPHTTEIIKVLMQKYNEYKRNGSVEYLVEENPHNSSLTPIFISITALIVLKLINHVGRT